MKGAFCKIQEMDKANELPDCLIVTGRVVDFVVLVSLT